MPILELLSPARDLATAKAAIDHGADAVYIGPESFGARAAAGNSTADIKELCRYAHQFGVRVYVTFNTLIYEHELAQAQKLIGELYDCGVDALIVQDMAVLEMDIPPIELHASTQTDARTPQKASWLAKAGFAQIVVPREFTPSEIRAVADAVGPSTAIEAFVHGALCVSYSGDCQAGQILAGRSANRGDCPQICRLKFTLTDQSGNPLTSTPSRHWLSLADMNRLDSLTELIDAGVTSFKIEGRLKSPDYVKNITASYSRALDTIIDASDGSLKRASFGKTQINFTPAPEKSFNRGFTSYFQSRKPLEGLTSWSTPKWTGPKVAVAGNSKGLMLELQDIGAGITLSNGDGLGYFNPDGEFTGFRVNRAEGGRIFAAPGSVLPHEGTALYRNNDVAFESVLARSDSGLRTIDVDLTLRLLPDLRLALDLVDIRGARATVTTDETFPDRAKTPQFDRRRDALGKTGTTIYRLNTLTDQATDAFIPAKALTDLRRRGLEALDADWRIKYSRPLRRKSVLERDELASMLTSYHDNMANSLAERFYTSHGAKIGQKAIEISSPEGETVIMTTRYCLRRQLGACLKASNANKLPSPLFLQAPIGRLRLDFDCQNCQMKVIKPV